MLGEGTGGGLRCSVLERLSLREWCNIHANISLSKLVMHEEMKGVSREVEK